MTSSPAIDIDLIVAEKKRRERRAWANRSTSNFAEVTKNNSYNPAEDSYPWLPYAYDMASYLDKDCVGTAKPVKMAFIARGHLKTIIAANGFAKYVANNPERRSAIISATDLKAQQNLNLVNGYLKSEDVQELYPDTLYPNDSHAKDYYTKTWTMVKREGAPAEPSVSVFGYTSSMAGKHFNGIIWIDDIVTETNCSNPEIQKEIWTKLQHIIQYVAVAGCEIWITGTRYKLFDAYSFMLDKDEKFHKRIEEGMIDMGCKRECPHTGEEESIFTFRYCMKPEDKNIPVEYKGKVYHPTRESLTELQDETDPEEWWAQMENSPIAGHNVTFEQEKFHSTLDCKGIELDNWLKNNGQTIDPENPDRGILDTTIAGDYAYSDKTHNDWSISILVSQDEYDHWYVRRARMTKDGWKGLKRHLQVAYTWKRDYSARELTIETHAKEALKAIAKQVEQETGIRAKWNPLKLNSTAHKADRIAIALEDLVRDGRLHFCDDPDVEKFRQMLITQAMQFPTKSSAKVHDDALDALANCRQAFKPRNGKQRNKKVKTANFKEVLPKRLSRFIK